MISLLIKNAWLLTMQGEACGFVEKGAVAVDKDKIISVGKTEELENKWQAEKVIDATGKVVLPGLIDAHIHTGMALYRGVAQDMNNWLQKGVGPFFNGITDEEISIGSMLNVLEGIKAGTTTFGDYDYPMARIVNNHYQAGVRCHVASMVNELPSNLHHLRVGEIYPLDQTIGKRKLKEAIELLDKWHRKGNGRITCALGPQGADMVSKELLLEMRKLAKTYGVKVHIHVAQGERETDQMIKRYGMRTVEYLNSIGYLDEDLMAVHLTDATKEEVELLAKSGVSMIHCPGSIGLIDGIVPPVIEYMEAGGKVGLGSDQAPGNNCNNMFNEMKSAAIFNKIKKADPTVMPAEKALRLATIEGAKAIGLEKEVGSLEVGKKADMIIVNMQEPGLSPVILKPVNNIVANLVYSARGHEVETSIIDGEIIMENRWIRSVDEQEVIQKAQRAANSLSERIVKRIQSVNN
ncbi:5-methylthioadenosine/S-adenosylhomocysteine deaminase [Tindallia magadiensis]|uniref:5-methylthioadenosine/S-adenosylhomocysteine deaminase n=1 Tax=Tindallia magadiensis TaxID=69895 RepID=A0A1I3DYJ0_9FIRM|nr:amidohydrolase [Tindallia magadiensis]SFH91807.1 5-methylthioadenosine/S-adenosylhomocysteine deaminase [Tindallia magadiensis]